jgi:hypothetical protein
MMLDLLGRLLEASARLRPGLAGNDRAHVGGEFRRLDRAPGQAPATSR